MLVLQKVEKSGQILISLTKEKEKRTTFKLQKSGTEEEIPSWPYRNPKDCNGMQWTAVHQHNRRRWQSNWEWSEEKPRALERRGTLPQHIPLAPSCACSLGRRPAREMLGSSWTLSEPERLCFFSLKKQKTVTIDICRIQKSGTDEPMCTAGIETLV